MDIINDGKNNKPILAKTGEYSGQMWKLTKSGAIKKAENKPAEAKPTQSIAVFAGYDRPTESSFALSSSYQYNSMTGENVIATPYGSTVRCIEVVNWGNNKVNIRTYDFNGKACGQ